MKLHEASLVGITPRAEQTCIYCARVSNPANQENPDYEKLVRYLIKERHWSPFEMANMVLEINTTRAVSPQILRHRSFSFQEFSQRYSKSTELNDQIPLPNLRSQDLKNKQASHNDIPDDLQRSLSIDIDGLYEHAAEVYKNLLENGVAKECAREVLPLGVPTRLYMNGTLRSWITYIALREKNGTQLEHQQIALSCKRILSEQCPTIAKALGGPDVPWEI
ncbi:MAG: FAD-dependent thymidylate synthase [bacterium]|jgi:thymidylate synthase (FAD)